MKNLLNRCWPLPWAALLVGLAYLLDDKPTAIGLTLALAFRKELGTLLVRRRISFRMIGFRCRIDDGPGPDV